MSVGVVLLNLMLQTQATLMSKPNSVFALMLEAEEPASQEQFQALDEVEREVFIYVTSTDLEKLQQKMNKWGVKGEEYRFDRDSEFFVPILNYLRTGKLIYSPNVLHLCILLIDRYPSKEF